MASQADYTLSPPCPAMAAGPFFQLLSNNNFPYLQRFHGALFKTMKHQLRQNDEGTGSDDPVPSFAAQLQIRSDAFGRGCPEIDIGFLGIDIDLGQFLRRELVVIQGCDAIDDLRGTAGADQRRGHPAAA